MRGRASIGAIFESIWGLTVKKGVIALILFLVLVIIVSPGIVGKFAEKSVDDSLNRAADESGELVVISQSFDRGWFSSEGQHRIELGDGQIRSAIDLANGDGSNEQMPALLINTHIDHGLIPVSSMGRDEGSLAPRLGSAVSTLTVELGDGETFDVPGTIYSRLGLGGDLDSRYELEAGSKAADDGDVTWEATSIHVASDANMSKIDFDGTVGAMTFGDDQQLVSIEGLTFNGTQTATEYGFNVGDVEMIMGPMSVSSGSMEIGGNKGLNLKGSSSLDDGSVTGDMSFEMSGQTIPNFGDLSMIAEINFSGFDAAAVGALKSRLDELSGAQDPTMALMSSEEELKDMMAGGFDFDIEQLDVGLPMGTVETRMKVTVPESDRDTFEWTSLLLAAQASLDIKVPEAIIQLASSMDPEVGAIIGLGYLKKNGDNYEMAAEYKKGLLTVNGAPIPIPLGAFQ
jgi:uncharacterized protein YdgA (DUF945 family)